MQKALHTKSALRFLRGWEALSALAILLLMVAIILTGLASPASASTGVCGHITSDTTWNTAGSVYVMNCTVTVDPGVKLTIEPGVVVKAGSATYSLIVDGTLFADQSTFTSLKDDSYGGDTNGDGAATTAAPGDWNAVSFRTGSSGYLHGSTVLFGGGSSIYEVAVNGSSPDISNSTIKNSQDDGLYIASGDPTITGNTFADNGSDGLYSVATLTTVSGNTFTGNGGVALRLPATVGSGGVSGNTYDGNAHDGMYLTGDVTAETIWPASNSPYVLEDSTVDVNAPLTIETDTVVKLGAAASYPYAQSMSVSNYLNAAGTVFTSYKDDFHGGDTNGDGDITAPMPGDWNRVVFASGSTGTLAGCVISYGGGASIGELFIASSPTITGTAVSHSNTAGIAFAGGSPSLHYNDIFANTTYGINDYGGVNLDATNNYWGSKHGPEPYGSGNGFNGPVNASPWARIPFTEAGAAYQATLGMDDYCALCGDPVNTASGAYVYNHTDINVPAKGLPLAFTRTYNSDDRIDGPLGYGWSTNWQLSPNQQANGDVVILREDGRGDRFIKNPDGSFTPPSGKHDVLTRDPSGAYQLTSQDKTVSEFNLDNSLATTTSPQGQATSYTYDTDKRLTQVADETGRTLSIAYNAENRIDHITDPAGGTVSFSYSPEGDLTSVTDQNGGVTSYTYDSEHRITSVTDPNSHTDANNVYDVVSGKVISQTDADGVLITFGYDDENNKTTMTRQMDPNDPDQDQINAFFYDEEHRIIRTDDPYNNSTTYAYDAAGNQYMVTDRRGTETYRVFDAAGNVTDAYKAYGTPEEQHTSYIYNSQNRPIAETGPRGQTTTYTYDGSGINLTQVDYPTVTSYDGTYASYFESYTYNPDGTVATSTDKNGDVTSYSYDDNGYLASKTENSNRPTEYQITTTCTYDILGRKTAETDGEGHTISYQYDAIGNLRFITKQVTDPGTGQPVDVTTEYTYGGAGNKTGEIDPEGKSTTYEYTLMNRLSRITDAASNTIEYTYDAAGNKTGTKDRNNEWSYFTFDKNNRMTSATDPAQKVTTYDYDEEGNQTSVTDPMANTTIRTYDALGRLTTVNEPDEGGETRTTTYAYDSEDNLLSVTDPASHASTYDYDELNRLKQSTDPTLNSLYFAYDGMGNTVKMKDQRSNETAYDYDPEDNLTQVSDPAGGITSYAYDKTGNRTSQTNTLGNTTLYTYDELGRLTQEKTGDGAGGYLLDRDYTYDKAGNLTGDTTGEGTISYSYDDVYNMTGITGRDDATYTFTYDGNQNQLTAVEDATGKTVSFGYNTRGLINTYTDAYGATQDYSYDGAANLTQKDDNVGGENFTTSYGYTPRNQQKTVTRGTATTSYTYDPAGNLAAKSYSNGEDTTFGYDDAGRMTSLVTTKGEETLNSFAQSYDAAGNITSQYDGHYGTSTYSYDSLNRLTSENLDGIGETTYTYDDDGNRTTATQPSPEGGPALALSMTRIYWASYQDWLDHKLSIDYRITNNGPGTAIKTKVTNSTATNGVYLVTQAPVLLGDISEGTYAPFTLQFYIPSGVGSFQATVYSTCAAPGGTDYYYPAKRDFYSYNQANQLVEILDHDGETTTFSYDAGGALTEETTGSEATTYSYSGLDKLTEVATPSTTVGYSYDPLGRRIERSEGTDTQNYHLYRNTDLTDYQTDSEGALTLSAQRGADGLISTTDHSGQSPETSYYLYSPHGDTTALTDSNGTVASTYRYDSFGNELSDGSPVYGYTGKWQRDFDQTTQTIQMGARQYDPALGRFTSADPFKGTPTDPQQRNRYPYVGNNPMTRYDLNGFKSITLEEAEMHWRIGGGTPLYVDMGDLDFSCVCEDDFPNGIGSQELLNLSFQDCREGLVFGRLWLTYLGDRRVKASDGFDDYNFDTGGPDKRWFESPYGFVRNCETWAGRAHAGFFGTDYKIYLLGEGTIGPRESSWTDIFIPV